jgi:hypothetical protein
MLTKLYERYRKYIHSFIHSFIHSNTPKASCDWFSALHCGRNVSTFFLRSRCFFLEWQYNQMMNKIQVTRIYRVSNKALSGFARSYLGSP